jgi:transcription elongation GreA/GreB family factor
MDDLKRAVILALMETVKSRCRTIDFESNQALQDSQDQRDKMESGYDSRKEEACDLLNGHHRRHAECFLVLADLKKILDQEYFPVNEVVVGSLVEVEDLDEQTRLFYCLLPRGGAESYQFNDQVVWAIDPSSALAEALKTYGPGEEIYFTVPKEEKYYRIISVR